MKPVSRWEIVGAWLHIWTPPKDVEVPLVPMRKIAVGALALAAATAVGLALLIPPLQSGKRRGEAERARERAANIAAERARLRADQRVHRVTLPAADDGVPALERAITADAKARDRAGTISGPVRGTDCEPASADSARFPASRVYRCFVKTGTGAEADRGTVLATGYSFIATIYTGRRTAAWCKHNPQADESLRHEIGVRLSPECAGRLASVL
jgi:hypothetical protein